MKKQRSIALDRLEALIREGKGREVRNALKGVLPHTVPRAQLAALANLGWRVSLPQWSVRLLNPIVRPSGRRPVSATEAEKTEYAVCLTKIGASEEAQELLETVNVAKNPRALLFKAFAQISQWDYRAAIPLLESYTQSPKIEEYQRIVGKVNLVEALIHERRHAPAKSLLRELVAVSEKGRYPLVYAKVLELYAQHSVDQQDWKQAEFYVHSAENHLAQTGSIEHFFAQKWRALASFLRQPESREALAGLKDLRAKAVGLRHWETVRDCDRYIATRTNDHALIVKIYFGTPFERFKEQLLQDCPQKVALPSFYEWQLSQTEGKTVFDLFSGRPPSGKAELKPGQLLHRLLSLLSLDFYRPQRVAALHYGLYPREHFNPTTSAARIHEAVKRLREWLASSRIPLAITQSHGSYVLGASKPCALRIAERSGKQDPVSVTLATLSPTFRDQPFSVGDAARALDCSPRSAFSLLQKAQLSGVVSRTGQGKNTRYRF